MSICSHTNSHTEPILNLMVRTIDSICCLFCLNTPWSRGRNPNEDSHNSFAFLNCLCQFSSVQFSSVSQFCLTLCDPMNHSTSGLPVHHQLLEFTQTQVHQAGDAIQPSHPLSPPSPPAHYPSQHQVLFK